MNVVVNLGEYKPKESDILVFLDGEWKLVKKDVFLDKIIKRIYDDEKKIKTLEKDTMEIKEKIKTLGEVMKGVVEKW